MDKRHGYGASVLVGIVLLACACDPDEAPTTVARTGDNPADSATELLDPSLPDPWKTAPWWIHPPPENPIDRLRVTATLLSIDGAYDAQVLNRYMRRKYLRWRDCYVERLATRGDLRGTVAATFQIDAAGRTADIATTGLDPELSACITRTLATVQVPRPGQGAVQVNYRFEFAPTGGRSRSMVPRPYNE